MAAVVLGFVGAGAGHAQVATDTEQGTITTVTIGQLGTRVIGPLAPVAMAQVDAVNLTGTMVVNVLEAARSGNNPWNVTVELDSNFTGVLQASNSIPTSALSIANRSTVGLNPLLSGVTINGVAGSEAFSAPGTPVSLYSVAGQATTVLYTNTYTTTAGLTLALPENTPRDAYTTTFTVTLLQ